MRKMFLLVQIIYFCGRWSQFPSDIHCLENSVIRYYSVIMLFVLLYCRYVGLFMYLSIKIFIVWKILL